MEENKAPNFATIEEAADFWDVHDLTDYQVEDVDFEVGLEQRRYLVALAPELSRKLEQVAHEQGLVTETLVNLWLNEKLQEAA